MRTGYFLLFCFVYTAANYMINCTAYAAESGNDLEQAKHAIEENHYPQAEYYLMQWLNLNKTDWDAKFLLARVYAWQHKLQKSHDLYDELLKHYPKNSDYLLGKAQVYLWNNTPQPALPLLSRARQLSPFYREVWRLELQTLKRLPDNNSQILFKSLLVQSQQQFAGESWLKEFSDDKKIHTKSKTQLEVETKIDKLSDQLPSWYSYGLGATHKKNKTYTLNAKLRDIKRFDQKDQEIDLGIYYNVNTKWFFGFDSSYSPSYNVLPRHSFNTYIGLNFPEGYNIQVGKKLRNYAYADISSSNIVFEQYLSNYRFRYTLYIITIDGKYISEETVLSQSIDFAYYYTRTNSIAISLAKGKELEYDGSPSALVTDIKNVSFYGTHWFRNSNWAPKYQFEYQQQGKVYSRYGLYFSLLYQF